MLPPLSFATRLEAFVQPGNTSLRWEDEGGSWLIEAAVTVTCGFASCLTVREPRVGLSMELTGLSDGTVVAGVLDACERLQQVPCRLEWPVVALPHFTCPRTESTHEAVELANG